MNLIKYLSIVDRHTKIALDQRLAHLRINSSQQMYIIRICETPGLSQEQLMSMYYIHPSNVTRALKHLQNTGYIYKETHEKDKRMSRLYPTEKAYQACEQIKEIKKELQNTLLQAIPPDERQNFYENLKKLALQAVSIDQPGKEFPWKQKEE